MFAPQVVVNEVIRKAAELDPASARKLIEENNFQSMILSTVSSAYVKGVIEHTAGSVDWLGIADDLKNFPPAEGILPQPKNVPRMQGLVSEWAKVDPSAALDWYVSDAEIELNQAEGSAAIGRILGGVPPESQSRAVKWMEQAREQGNWNEKVVGNYGEALALSGTSLGPHVERAVSWISDEDERYEFVARFIPPQTRLPIQSLDGGAFQFDRAELVNLVHAANLPATKRSDLLQRIESRK